MCKGSFAIPVIDEAITEVVAATTAPAAVAATENSVLVIRI